MSTTSSSILSLSSFPTSLFSSHSITFVHKLPPPLQPFFSLSYPIPPLPPQNLSNDDPTIPYTTLYSKGYKDACIVITCAVGFTLLRAVLIRYVFSAFPRWWLDPGRHSIKKEMNSEREERLTRRRREHIVSRFSEQAWSFCYCAIVWSTGMTILRRIPNRLSPEQLWGTYPVRYLPGLTKMYYLGQLGWWFHQIYVLNTEQRRTDHWQMFSHHILTICLIVGSYAAHFTRVGTLIHVLMDFCDIIFPLAKIFRYLSLTLLCDLTFVVFLVSWLVSREIGLLLVIKTSFFDAPNYIAYKWSPEQGHYFKPSTYRAFITMECILLILQTVWFYAACLVAVRVARGLGAEDSRSDDGIEDTPERELETISSCHTSMPVAEEHDKKNDGLHNDGDLQDNDNTTTMNNKVGSRENGDSTAVNGVGGRIRKRLV
ncbi:hypothetical protein TREMEDRAFT_30795 [Tremella mesenterica DSM 1558]|uniref:uncharacterized protein n=1 Tax=Tremella mesenterica (strain ATCC 24925 / CBS 8224 / DSM 1558 / NBRC 9311 / NRRL Y-6157 / RJB 2259-6 / UBC 559-6) TaxID=578456 RepID=UPI0003F49ABB|nr:uncharacterized protein TREMEDRAFT_30795 [Tremella mesenterica DSM 1558]EIW69517.1 hypothetical protein TREMEDRAFT_30795 [Tremella mesenterica DSM 1558]